MSLNVHDLLKTASERTGLSDFGPTDFLEDLTVLVDGVNKEVLVRADRREPLRERHAQSQYSSEMIGFTDAAIREVFAPYINMFSACLI